MTSCARCVVAVFTALLVLCFGTPAHAGGLRPPPASAYADPSCSAHRVAVSLGRGRPANQEVATWLCDSTAARTVIVTVSGTTYSHLYWDFPLDPDAYSAVRAFTKAGFAVLNYDRIGIGLSSHPSALASNGDANAWVVHELISNLRAGTIGGRSFDRVVIAAHSQGSLISLYEDALYQDADGLIVTGLPGAPLGTGFADLVANLVPAQLDPRFAGTSVPLGYMTTRTGSRTMFYDRATADPAVIAEDEATKDVMPPGELTIVPAFGETRLIRTPVLSVTGDHDQFFCVLPCSSPLSVPAIEPWLYGPEACLASFVVPDAGHDINLHPTAAMWYREAVSWILRRIGNGPDHPPSQACAGASSLGDSP